MEDQIETVEICSLKYKIGLFGYAYYWNNGEWVKSDKPARVIEDAILAEKRKK